MINSRQLKNANFLIWLMILINVGNADIKIYVSPHGKDHYSGTEQKPLYSIKKAIAITETEKEKVEIILKEGTYSQGMIYIKDKTKKKNPPLLTIRAERERNGKYKDVILNGGKKLLQNTPYKNFKNIYEFNASWHHKWFPSVWEVDTRTRYTKVPDVESVKTFPGTFCYLPKEKKVVIHTSDHRAPSEHNIGYTGAYRDGFRVWRPNVLFQGIKFHNFHVDPSSSGIVFIGPNQTAEECEVWNSTRGFMVGDSNSCIDNAIINCTARDVACGFFSYGINSRVENSRFFCKNDAFQIQIFNQNHAGIQYYSPAKHGMIRGNLTVGFTQGIFLKGNKGKFLIEKNTSVCGKLINWGIGCTHWSKDSILRYNIVVGHSNPLLMTKSFGGLPIGLIQDYNCFWKTESLQSIRDTFEASWEINTGLHTIYADPMFVNPKGDDYRLLPNSPCARLAPGGKPIGAMAVANDLNSDKISPELRISILKPGTLLNKRIDKYIQKDNWGKKRKEEFSKTMTDHNQKQWLIPDTNVKLKLIAKDYQNKINSMRFKINGAKWSKAETFHQRKNISLPKSENFFKIMVQVSDSANNWSKVQTLELYRSNQEPQFEQSPYVYSNSFGAIISFKTNVPVKSELEWGHDQHYGNRILMTNKLHRDWDTEEGERIYRFKGPKLQHHFVLVHPSIKKGDTIHYRIHLDDNIGHTTISQNFIVKIEGQATTYYLSPHGEDRDVQGSKNLPWKTLQFAVDRALPGDRIILKEGLYPGETIMTHGGLANAPIRIKSANKQKAILDGGKKTLSVLLLDKSPYVHLEGIEIRWAKSYCVYISESPFFKMKNCEIWGKDWAKGRNIVNGFLAFNSPGCHISYSLFYSLNSSLRLLDSPNFTLINNTIVKNIHRGAIITYSSRNSIIKNNSLSFCGNECFDMYEHKKDFDTLKMDYNNFTMRVRMGASRRRVEEEIAPVAGDFFVGNLSKGVNSIKFYSSKAFRAHSLLEWQTKTGKDKHSTIKYPYYSSPLNRDFRLQSQSPLKNMSEEKSFIGAFPVTRE